MRLPAITPGPWRISPRGNCDIENGDGSLEIASTHQDLLKGGYRDPGPARADAKAIAAVPAMLEALLAANEFARSQITADPARSVEANALIETTGAALRLAGASE